MRKTNPAIAIAVLLGTIGAFGPRTVRAQSSPTGQGCIVTGSGQGGAGENVNECKYTAPDDSQNVYIGTPNHWELYVLREGCPSYPYTCSPVLIDGCQPDPVHNTCVPYPCNSNCQCDASQSFCVTENEVVLLSGFGLPVGPPPVVQPRMGETVHVHIEIDAPGNLTPASGAWGFIAAGIDEGLP